MKRLLLAFALSLSAFGQTPAIPPVEITAQSPNGQFVAIALDGNGFMLANISGSGTQATNVIQGYVPPAAMTAVGPTGTSVYLKADGNGNLFINCQAGCVSSLTSSQVQNIIGPNVYDAYGAAVAVQQGNLGQFGITTSAQLASILSDEVGTGFVVFNASPTFTGGLQVGAPTGGSEGSGTINVAGGFYVNGVLVTSGSSVTWPTSADIVLSNGTNTPAGLAPVNGDCVLGSGGAWTAGSCGSATPAFSTIAAGTNTAALVIGTSGSLSVSGSGTITATAMSFAGLSSATNTTAAMVCGTGCSLAVSGSGTITASAVPFSGITAGSNAATGAFSTAGPWTFSTAGAASTPALSITGAYYNGGNGTTDTPQLYINDGSAPSTWSTNGTFFGINGSNLFSGNYIDIHTNGGSAVFTVSSAGAVTASSNISGSSIFGTTFETANNQLFGWSSTGSDGGTRDTILCRGASGGIAEVQSAASCTNTLAGATGTLALANLDVGSTGLLGTIVFGNATSGTVTLEPVTGALGSVTASLPANTGTIGELNLAQTWSAAQTNSTAGVASVSAETWTGAPYTAGNATTNFPLVYINDGTGPSTFSTSGTEFGINSPSGFAGNFIDVHLNGGTSVLTLSSGGNLTISNSYIAAAAGQYQLSGRANISSPSTGVLDVGTGGTAGIGGTVAATNADIGAAGTLGTIVFGNATSGTVTLETVTGALGTVTASLPANTGTIGELNLAQTWSAAQTNNTAGAASTSAETWIGAPYTAGNATTNFPLVYVNDGTGPSTFSTSGTEFGINSPSGFAGNFEDFHLNGGASVWSVSSAGNLTLAGTVNVTTTACLAAAVPVSTPCIAYTNSATGLSATFAGSTVTLYTTSAPAAAVFNFCPTEFQDTGTATPAGAAQMQVTWTTAGGTTETAAALQNITFQTGGGVGNGSCVSVSTQAGSTLSFKMTTSGGSGTVTWEYSLTVTRLR